MRIGQGKDNARKYLEENPEVANKIKAAILENFHLDYDLPASETVDKQTDSSAESSTDEN